MKISTLLNPRFKRSPIIKTLSFPYSIDPSIFQDLFFKGQFQDTAIVYSTVANYTTYPQVLVERLHSVSMNYRDKANKVLILQSEGNSEIFGSLMGVDDDLQFLCIDLHFKLIVCGSNQETAQLINAMAYLKNKPPVKELSLQTKEELQMLKSVEFELIDESDLDYLFMKYQVSVKQWKSLKEIIQRASDVQDIRDARFGRKKAQELKEFLFKPLQYQS